MTRTGSVDWREEQGGAPPRPSWWSRNWKWVVPVGCLGMILLPVACAGAIFLAVYGVIQGSEPYREALARAREHPEVVAALGEPLEAGLFVSGSINIRGSDGEADFSINVSGPEGEGTLHVEARKEAGAWSYEEMVLVVDATGERIDLLESPRLTLRGALQDLASRGGALRQLAAGDGSPASQRRAGTRPPGPGGAPRLASPCLPCGPIGRCGPCRMPPAGAGCADAGA